MKMNSMLPQYSTKTFSQVYPDVENFVNDYQRFPWFTGEDAPFLHDNTIQILYWLLIARYANNPIANRDQNQFCFKLFAIVWQYGPTWEKKLDIQKQLRNIDFSNDDWLQGAKAIYNTALNPETAPSTASLEELQYINQQNTTNYKRSKFDALAILASLLDDSFTEEFIRRFRVCFKQFVAPEDPLLFVTEEDED